MFLEQRHNSGEAGGPGLLDAIHDQVGGNVDAIEGIADIMQHVGGDFGHAGQPGGFDQLLVEVLHFGLGLFALGDIAHHGHLIRAVERDKRQARFHRIGGAVFAPVQDFHRGMARFFNLRVAGLEHGAVNPLRHLEHRQRHVTPRGCNPAPGRRSHWHPGSVPWPDPPRRCPRWSAQSARGTISAFPPLGGAR